MRQVGFLQHFKEELGSVRYEVRQRRGSSVEVRVSSGCYGFTSAPGDPQCFSWFGASLTASTALPVQPVTESGANA